MLELIWCPIIEYVDPLGKGGGLRVFTVKGFGHRGLFADQVAVSTWQIKRHHPSASQQGVLPSKTLTGQSSE